MIRNLLATTAIATLMAGGAFAQDTMPADPSVTQDPAATDQQQTPMTIHAEGRLASNLMGESVYNGTGEEAENIGKVTDLVIDQEGDIQAIVVGVGGFLGIGQKEVALEYDLVQWSERDDGERYMVVETTADALENQQEFDRAAYRPMPADADVAETQPATADDLAAAPAPEEGSEDATGETAMAPADDQAGMDQAGETTATAPADQTAPADGADDAMATATDEQQPSDDMAAAPEEGMSEQTTTAATDEEPAEDVTAAEDRQDRPAEETTAATQDQAATDRTQTGAIDRNSLQNAGQDQIRAENLTGANVYGANEEDIGEVGDVILTPDGEIDAVIIDVGGFLGIGQKEVAVGLDNISFMTDENGDLYLYTQYTQEELEAQPEYDEASYTEQRDQQRLQ
ncbi:PRC-barrel domain-containing protein [Chelativorans sp. M5D2P16]|uniref:PRC-barrel domain-containing protein n=1 Tax=Chelativorans sp. M5D2P16 TaxID=3095678 RepID=UPI002ACA0CF5|nr:PRC-barrel domain-containing protein [Chelativorans sp. M5D2P16]MDZ5699135.1 PRC-barrel domain-containing protein [Chelativorans sp. M5D2P16]